MSEAQSTYEALLAQREALDRQIREMHQQEVAKAIADIRETMARLGLTIADITKGRMTTSATAGTRAAATPKYRNPQTGETWAGRGRMPVWLQREVEAGKSQEDFRIKD